MSSYRNRISVLALATAILALSGSTIARAGILHKSKDKESSSSRKAAKAQRDNPLANVDSKQPDKALYDKAMIALKKGKFDVARLDLQTMLNTYPDSEYQMRAKLSIGDAWYKEGGSAALAQAEAEYKDFITFFPNAPEAAEAQMKVADIYYQQMEKPDRDYLKTQRAEDEYRTMILQFPDSTLVPRAKQRLREVQEVLGEREFEIGSFYATHANWAASIARLQTVIDTYPLYSHNDAVLLGLGDAYSAEATMARGLRLPEDAKARLVKVYSDQAANAYDRIVTRYPLAPHADDAKDRLAAMGRPVPEPTKEALAENEAEEQSRATVNIKDRALLLVSRRPATLMAARVGEPTLADPKSTTAPEVTKATVAAFNAAVNPGGQPAEGATASAGKTATGENAPPHTGDAPVVMESVPGDSGGGATGNSVGVQILNSPSGAPPAAAPAIGNPNPNPLPAVGPANTAPLAAAEKPAEAPDQINDVKASGAKIGTNAPNTAKKGKTKKPAEDLSTESSSKKKKKKGLDKLNPF